jgi:hypothetical protein
MVYQTTKESGNIATSSLICGEPREYWAVYTYKLPLIRLPPYWRIFRPYLSLRTSQIRNTIFFIQI